MLPRGSTATGGISSVTDAGIQASQAATAAIATASAVNADRDVDRAMTAPNRAAAPRPGPFSPRVARTAADFDGEAEVGTAQLAQALALRAEIG
jgi:hypothetical protein